MKGELLPGAGRTLLKRRGDNRELQEGRQAPAKIEGGFGNEFLGGAQQSSVIKEKMGGEYLGI